MRIQCGSCRHQQVKGRRWRKRGKNMHSMPGRLEQDRNINEELDDVKEEEIERTEKGERQMTERGKGSKRSDIQRERKMRETDK